MDLKARLWLSGKRRPTCTAEPGAPASPRTRTGGSGPCSPNCVGRSVYMQAVRCLSPQLGIEPKDAKDDPLTTWLDRPQAELHLYLPVP